MESRAGRARSAKPQLRSELNAARLKGDEPPGGRSRGDFPGAAGGGGGAARGPRPGAPEKWSVELEVSELCPARHFDTHP